MATCPLMLSYVGVPAPQQAEKRQRTGEPGLSPQWQSGQQGMAARAGSGGSRDLMPPPQNWGSGKAGARGGEGVAGGGRGFEKPGSSSLTFGGSSLVPPPMFLAAGGMDVMVQMMGNSNPDVNKQAAQAIFEACNDNPTNQQLVQEAGGVPKMVQLLQSSSAPEVKNRAAEAIAAACSQNRDNRLDALQNNALEPLVKMLDAGSVQTQESAANALANVIIPREGAGEQPEESGGSAGSRAEPSKSESAAKREEICEAQSTLNDLGGVARLIKLVEQGAPRVKEAAAAAIANAMVDNEQNRKAFQEAGGVGPLIGLLKSGDIHAQEHATTALWNAMVDNEATKIDLIKHPQVCSSWQASFAM